MVGSVLYISEEMLLAQSVHLGHAWPIMWRQKWKLTTHHRPKLHWLAPLTQSVAQCLQTTQKVSISQRLSNYLKKMARWRFQHQNSTLESKSAMQL